MLQTSDIATNDLPQPQKMHIAEILKILFIDPCHKLSLPVVSSVKFWLPTSFNYFWDQPVSRVIGLTPPLFDHISNVADTLLAKSVSNFSFPSSLLRLLHCLFCVSSLSDAIHHDLTQ